MLRKQVLMCFVFQKIIHNEFSESGISLNHNDDRSLVRNRTLKGKCFNLKFFLKMWDVDSQSHTQRFWIQLRLVGGIRILCLLYPSDVGRLEITLWIQSCGTTVCLSLVVSEAYRSDCFVFILEGMLDYFK